MSISNLTAKSNLAECSCIAAEKQEEANKLQEFIKFLVRAPLWS